MKKVVEVYGKTVESAIADAAVQLGVDREHLSYEILEEPKRGFLGFGEVPAKVRISYDTGDEDVAIDFVRTLIEDMGIDAVAEISDVGGGKLAPEQVRDVLLACDREQAGPTLPACGLFMNRLWYDDTPELDRFHLSD